MIPIVAIPAASDIETLIVPSAQTIAATYAALRRSVEQVNDECKALLDTIRAVDDVLAVLTGTGGVSGAWQAFGPLALPIPAMMKGFMSIASRLIKDKTNISVDDWTSFVATTRAQFEAYLAQLAQVAELSSNYDAAALAAKMDAAQLEADDALLRDTQARTRQLWKPVTERVAQLSQVVDALLESTSRLGPTNKPAEARTERTTGLLDPFQKGLQKISEAVEALKDTAAAQQRLLDNWLASRVEQLRDRTRQLNDQIAQLAGKIMALDDLLDLEIAQIRAHAGKISPEEVEVVSRRVAVMVLMPQLREQLLEAKERVAAYQGYQQKLDAAHRAAQVGDGVYQTLTTEYQASLDAANAHLTVLEAQAKVWRSQGSKLLEAGLLWMQEQVDIVKGRTLVGELKSPESNQQSDFLTREIERLEAAKRILASL